MAKIESEAKIKNDRDGLACLSSASKKDFPAVLRAFKDNPKLNLTLLDSSGRSVVSYLKSARDYEHKTPRPQGGHRTQTRSSDLATCLKLLGDQADKMLNTPDRYGKTPQDLEADMLFAENERRVARQQQREQDMAREKEAQEQAIRDYKEAPEGSRQDKPLSSLALGPKAQIKGILLGLESVAEAKFLGRDRHVILKTVDDNGKPLYISLPHDGLFGSNLAKGAKVFESEFIGKPMTLEVQNGIASKGQVDIKGESIVIAKTPAGFEAVKIGLDGTPQKVNVTQLLPRAPPLVLGR